MTEKKPPAKKPVSRKKTPAPASLPPATFGIARKQELRMKGLNPRLIDRGKGK